MSEINPWNVHGPVETLRIEFAMWDPVKQEWQPDKQHTLVRYRPDGQIVETEHHRQDGSISRSINTYDGASHLLEARSQTGDGPVVKTIHAYDGFGRLVRTTIIDEKGTSSDSEICRYDPGGRKTTIQFNPKMEGNGAYSVDLAGAAAFFGVVGGATTTTTNYDDQDQPTELLIHDTAHRLLRRMIYTRDSAGRLVKEEVQLGTESPFPDVENSFKDAPPEARDSIRATIAAIFGPNKAMSTTTYSYDRKGRLVERIMSMGVLGEHRFTFRFDDHDNPIEEINENTSREVQLDERSNLHPSNEASHRQHSRYVYKYDEMGNWTEREMWTIFGSDKDFKRSNIVRRVITYREAATGVR